MIIGTNFKLSSAKFLDDRQLCKDYATLIANTEGIIYPPGFEVFCEYENKYYQYISDTNGGYIWEERKSGVSDGTVGASIKDDTISENYTWSSAHIDSMRMDLENLITQANDYVDEIDERMLFIEGKFQWFEYFDGSYESLTDKPTIPTKVSELENDSEFIGLERLELEREDINEELSKKIDIEEDRTLIPITELERLATLGNYNDTEIKQQIEELELQSHTHINSDILNSITEEKINQWNDNTGVNDYNYIQNKPITRVGDDSDILLNFSEIIDEGMYIITAMVGEYKVHNELVFVKWTDDDNVKLTIPNMFIVLNVNRTNGVWSIVNELHYGVDKENGKISDTLTIGEDKIILDNEGNGWYGGKVSQEGIPTEDKDLVTKGYVDNKFATNERIDAIDKENARRDVIIEALANGRKRTVEIDGNDVDLMFSTEKDNVWIDKIEGETLVNVCDQEEPIAITKSYTVEGTNHVPLQGEYDGKCRPIVQGNTLVNHNIEYDKSVITGERLDNTQGTEILNLKGTPGCEIKVDIDGHTAINLSTKKEDILCKSFDSMGGNELVVVSEENSVSDLVLQGNTMYYNNDTNEYLTEFVENSNLSLQSTFEDKLIPYSIYNGDNLTSITETQYQLPLTVEVGKTYTITTTANVGTTENHKYQYGVYSADGLTNYLEYETSTTTQTFVCDKADILFKVRIYPLYSGDDYSFTLSEVQDKFLIVEGDWSSRLDLLTEEYFGKYKVDMSSIDNDTSEIITSKTVYLNSPLLNGDELVMKDGKLYHYHKMGMEILDGGEDEDWKGDSVFDNTIYFYKIPSKQAKPSQIPICDKIKGFQIGNNDNAENIFIYSSGNLNISVLKSKLSTTDLNGFRQWLSENPTTVVYELASPYYEEISSTEDMRFNIATNSTIEYQSSVPMANTQFLPYRNELPLLESSTQYRVTFDCDVEGLELMVSLGGTSQTITSALHNELSFITPSLQTDGKLTIDGYGIAKIDNVLITKGDMEYKYFEGLKSGFEDGYIPENLTNINEQLPFNVTFNYDTKARNILKITDFTFKPNTTYTVKIDGINNSEGTFMATTDSGEGGGMNIKPSSLPLIEKITTNNKVGNLWIYWTTDCGSSRSCTIDSISILEGDWTHLTEEDWNNLGTYKATIRIQNPNAPIFGKGGRL